MSVDGVYAKMADRYARGDVPWDSPLPPPEVQEFVASHPTGWALDLGCGYGRASLYLAQNGWDVDGIDIVPQAIDGAIERGKVAGVEARFHCHSITDLSFLDGAYDYAIDVGCAHNLSEPLWRLHHAELKRLLRVGATYMIYGRVLGVKDWGIDEPTLLPIMEEGFRLVKREPGVTHMADGESWASVWLWFERV